VRKQDQRARCTDAVRAYAWAAGAQLRSTRTYGGQDRIFTCLLWELRQVTGHSDRSQSKIEQTLTSGRISTDLLNQFGEPVEPAGEVPAFFLRNEQLPFINDVTIEGPLP
jgi:hypothetical protein